MNRGLRSVACCIALSGWTALAAQDPADDWWSLRSLPAAASDPAPPPIDALLDSRQAEAGLVPAPPADRRTLIRRLTFDLHGLPPTPEDIESFVDDPHPSAYARLVDRLLASPRYGERFGRFWLDLAHYADTHGYDKDKVRPNAWPYRDWVIQALNTDLPFARFAELQIAGDVLAPGDPDGIKALGFLAAGPWDFVGHVELREGTVDKDITRSLDRDDMVATVMATFASTTATCARCHDHKFDPVPQRDYYRLQAVFAGVERADRIYEGGAHSEYLTSNAGTLGYHSAIVPEQETTKWVQVDLGAVQALDEVVLLPAHEVYGGHPGPGFGFPRRFAVSLSNDADGADAVTIANHTAADFAHPGDDPVHIDCGGRTARYVRITATHLFERTDDWIFALGELLALDAAGTNLAAGAAVTALDSIEAGGAWGRAYLTDQAARRSGKSVYVATASFRSNGSFTPPPAGLPRPIHVLARGDVRQPGEEVDPGALSCLPQLAHHFDGLPGDDESARRAALAAWITDPANPLTWRSIVNRVWQFHFGEGLVDTPSDFGRMGSRPSHPELLDALAVWFRDSGGSLKDLHRLLLHTRAWQRASTASDTALAADAQNRLLGRFTRRRLDAEELRDAMLACSGRLDLTMGGPPVRWFGFENDHSPRYLYQDFDPDGEGANRRAVYRLIVRSVPDPLFETFDCADPSALTPKRFTTQTPLQALALLNDRFVLRQAEHFAAQLEREAEGMDARVTRAFEIALGRQPEQHELTLLRDHATTQGLASACRVVFNLNEFVFVD